MRAQMLSEPKASAYSIAVVRPSFAAKFDSQHSKRLAEGCTEYSKGATTLALRTSSKQYGSSPLSSTRLET
eukprot:CAMPEP_0114565800 /NCGR_PEP_ID=MMETSP0114-20121206/14517_1 /TAXON_ID=31324 /ORGANISM="Goniomonas sp, Strain m" /LENGTH=70 /DNA_ID=CAMNT_0001752099 /DNA_START=219 /DNA_END=431 /DNA_ORIENTATION=+